MVDSSIPNMLPVDIKNKIHGLLVHYFGNEDDMADERPKKLLVDVLALFLMQARVMLTQIYLLKSTNCVSFISNLYFIWSFFSCLDFNFKFIFSAKSCNPTDQNNDEKNDVTSAHSPKVPYCFIFIFYL